MTIFHIKYPRKRDFLKWDELGCLARTLGFHIELFRENLTDEITVQNDGLLVEEVLKMLDYRLLHKVLHHTVNMHTAEWNMAAIRKCILLLSHKALSFEEINNVRVAYQLYEAGDMKGMILDKHTLLRSLKMCGRTIAPLKLMHRIKHMKEAFEEVGRIQLSEYFDLILWCDLYFGFNPKDMEYPEGKENKLFKLVDFEKLLSHHDERVSWALNRQYLDEEWDFGMENLGSKEMFKEPPITNEARIQQTKLHKRKYRHLKHEVGFSQKRVYRAHAGYIRDRPITAPDLSMYEAKREEMETARTTAQDAYQSVRRRLKSAPPSTRASLYTDRPMTRQYQRQATPPAVTRTDLSEVETKMNSLTFDMITLESKYEIDKAENLDYFLPGYREKLAKRPPPSPPPEPVKEPPKSPHWTEEVIESLVHPSRRHSTAHNVRCDARQRGWQYMKKRKGSHQVLVSSSFDNSPKGQLFKKIQERTYGPVKHIHKDHLVRYTKSRQVEPRKGQTVKRPDTAPAVVSRKQVKSGGSLGEQKTSASTSASALGSGSGAPFVASTVSSAVVDSPSVAKNVDVHQQQEDPKVLAKDNQCDDDKENVDEVFVQDETDDIERCEDEENSLKETSAKDPSEVMFKFNSLKVDGSREMLKNNGSSIPEGKADDKQKHKVEDDEGFADDHISDSIDIPVPTMSHSKPKLVEVGHIGTISLLEKIEESKDLEDKFGTTSKKYANNKTYSVPELTSPPPYSKFSEENIQTSTPGRKVPKNGTKDAKEDVQRITEPTPVGSGEITSQKPFVPSKLFLNEESKSSQVETDSGTATEVVDHGKPSKSQFSRSEQVLVNHCKPQDQPQISNSQMLRKLQPSQEPLQIPKKYPISEKTSDDEKVLQIQRSYLISPKEPSQTHSKSLLAKKQEYSQISNYPNSAKYPCPQRTQIQICPKSPKSPHSLRSPLLQRTSGNLTKPQEASQVWKNPQTSGKHVNEDSQTPRSSNVRCRRGKGDNCVSLKRVHSDGNNCKHLRLVQRVDNCISPDLQIRLLTYGKCS